MNHFYRSIWNKKTGNFVAVSENTKSQGKSASGSAGTGTGLALTTLAASMAMAFCAPAWAAPVNGVVTAGTATVTTAATTTTVNQTSQNVSLNWLSFNIGAGETVRFVQPNSQSVALNRVLGTDPTSILGSLNANGKVFLVNPNGILFGKGASVNVGGLVASTLDLSDADFASGKYRFSGNSGAGVVNQGSITAADGGYVALLGANVSNQGVISARLGTVALAAGDAVTLDVAGDGLVNITVDKGALKALADNGGLLQANGGAVLMTSKSAGNLLGSAVNNTGLIQAQSIDTRSGTIRLLGDMAHGVVQAGGTLDASAPNGGDGGFIDTSAASVVIADSLKVSTNAPQGKTGNWLIDPVDFNIAATGGNITGAFLSGALNTTSVKILSSSGNSGVAGNVNVNDTVSWSANKLTLSAYNDININKTMTATGSATLALETGMSPDYWTTIGNININAPVNLPSGYTLTKQRGMYGYAERYMVINSLGAQGSLTGTDLQGLNGNLYSAYALGSNIDASATAGWNAGAGFMPLGTLNSPFSGQFDGLGHTITGLAINRPTTDYVGLFGVATNYYSSYKQVSNLGLVDPSITGRIYAGALAGRIDSSNFGFNTVTGGTVSGVDSVGGMVGEALRSSLVDSRASASVSGRNWTGGLVGFADNSNQSFDRNSASGNVTGTGFGIGGLFGSTGAGIRNSFATGTVQGASNAGGLAGSAVSANIYQSYATGNVTASGNSAGGLVGNADGGSIAESYAAGSVSALRMAGGLVGTAPNRGSFVNNYALGAVMAGTTTAGGLIGSMTNASVSTSYSTGAVSAPLLAGGLVGTSTGSNVTSSYWNTDTSGRATSTGGTGLTSVAMQTASSFSGFNFTSTPGQAGNSWVIVNADGRLNNAGGVAGATRPMLASEYATTVRNAHQLQLVAMNLGGQYTLAGDIDAARTGLATDVWSNASFVPLGTHIAGLPGSTYIPFTGSFDGAGYRINGLTINTPAREVVGMFIQVGAAGSVKQLGLSGGFVIGSNITGGLAGHNLGTISASYVANSVTGAATTGGLVGINSGTIDHAFASGPVTGTIGVGGLAGSNVGTITNSYATAAVNGTSTVGGLLGFTQGGQVSNVYASGSVAGTTTVGGLIGTRNATTPGTISNAFWNTGVKANGVGTGSATGLTGLTAAGMMTQQNFTGFSFGNPLASAGNNWIMYEGISAPLLRSFLSNITVTGNSASKTYDKVAYVVSGSATYGAPVTKTLNGTLSYTGTAQGAVNAGTYTILPGGLSSDQLGYYFDYVPGILTVNKAPVMIGGVVVANKVYDGGTAASVNAAGGSVLSGVLGGDSVTFAGATAQFADRNAGYKPVSVAVTLGGSSAANYTAFPTSYAAEITRKQINMIAPVITREYNGDTFAFSTSAEMARLTSQLGVAGDVVDYAYYFFSDKNAGVGNKTVRVGYASINDGNYGYNYNVVYGTNNTSTITKKAATYSGVLVNNKVYDGSTSGVANTSAASFSGLYYYDTVTAAATATFADRNVGSGKAVALSYVFGGADAGNYTIAAQASSTAAITPKSVTINAPDMVKTYDGTTGYTTGAADLASMSASLGVAGDTVSAATMRYLDKNAGTGKLVQLSQATVADGNGGNNYRVTLASTTPGTIVPKALTVGGIGADGKVYDGSTAATVSTVGATLTGLVAGDQLGVSATGVFADRHAGIGKTVVLTSTFDGADRNNYAITPQASTTASIAPKAVTLAAPAAVKTYDGATAYSASAADLAALGAQLGVAGDTVDAITLAFDTRQAGTGKTVTASAANLSDGNGGKNYALSYSASNAGVIAQRALAIGGIVAASKVYDGNTSAQVSTAGATYAGLVAGDAIGLAAVGEFTNRNAGSGKTVALTSSYAGADAANYAITGQLTATGEILARPVTLLAPVVSKAYDGSVAHVTTVADLTSMSAQLGISGDTISAVTLAYTDRNAGTGKTVNASAAAISDGNGGNNYVVGYAGNSASTITPKQLTALATAQGKVYDGTTAANATVALAGLVGSETLGATGAATFNSKDVLAANLVTVNNVVLADGANGGLAGNYALAAGQTAAASISAKTLTANAVAANKVYDGTALANATLAITGGLVGSETLGATAAASFNSKDVLAANLVTVNAVTLANGGNGGLASNYALAAGQSAAASITPKALAASASAAGKTYDGNTSATASLAITGGLVGAETLVASGTATFNSKDVSAANSVTVNTTTLANGSNGGLASNYTLSAGQTAAAAITAKALTASATAAGKTYDGITSANATLSIIGGLVGSETLGATGTATFNSKDVLAANSVTVHTTTLANGSNGGLASNYTLSAGQTAAASISAKSLMASAVAANKVYDGTTLAKATLAITGGLVGSETLGATAAASFNSKDVLAANLVTVNAVTLANGGNGALASNYALAAGQSAAASITPKSLAASATAAGKTYDGNTTANATLSITGGLVGSETVGATGAATFNSKDVLSANLVTVNSTVLSNGANGALASNYQLTPGQTAVAAITPKALQVVGLAAASKIYDGNTNAAISGAVLLGLAGTETLAISGLQGTFADKNVGNGKVVALGALGLANAGSGATAGVASNYTLAQPASLSANIFRLATATWVGGTTGNWFDPANWAGGAVPDLSNAANVTVPAGVTISFNNGSVVTPAQGGPVKLDTLAGAGALAVAAGSLNVAGGLQLGGLNLSGGAISAGTNMAIGSMTQTGGTLSAGGSVSINQPLGSISLGNITAGGALTVNAAAGSIVQVPNSTIVAAPNSQLVARTGDVLLNAGNALPNPVIASGNASLRQAAIGDVIRTTSDDEASDDLLPGVRNRVSAALEAVNVDIVGPGIRLPAGGSPGE